MITNSIGLKPNFSSKAYSDAIMEDCIMSDLGYAKDNFVDAKAAENTVRETFEKLNVGFWKTNDGYQIGINGSSTGDKEYCIVYVSFNRVISFDIDVTVNDGDKIALWNAINEALISYFFK